ncbi:MAG: hypothetical protein NZM35_10330 [Chitinophagales bacterium]|nr:hypothetical protein [Chitinophagales bacterium]MDW8419693.1 hypothetical protein [Chitinophagales bacterium]
MFFVSHYLYEGAPASPYVAAGLTIPDLKRGFTRIYHRHIHNTVTPAGELLSALHEGIQRHYAADRQFHSSVWFNQQCHDFLHMMEHEGLNRRRLRLSVLAHLGVELLLEAMLVRYQTSVVDKYYDLLNCIETSVLSKYFERMGIPDTGQKILTNFISFKQRRYIYLLSENKQVVSAMVNIYVPVTGVAITEEETLHLLTAVNNINGQIRYTWRKVFNK